MFNAKTDQCRRHRHDAFTLVELLVVIAIIGVLVALLLPAVQAAREASRRSSCSNNLKNLTLACLNYEVSLGEFPSAGQNVTSGSSKANVGWHFQILPYVEQGNIAEAVRQNGISQATKEATIGIFWCPSRDRDIIEDFEAVDNAKSTYYGVMGAARNGDCLRGNVYEPGGPGTLEQSHCGAIARDGMIIPFENVPFKSITDGSSQTMLVGERTYQLRSYFNGARLIQGGSPEKATKVCVDNAKNMRWGISTPEETGYYVQSPSAPAGAPKTVLFNDFFWGSEHPGVVLFAFADGSVRTIANETELSILKNMASRNGGEQTEEDMLDDGSCYGS